MIRYHQPLLSLDIVIILVIVLANPVLCFIGRLNLGSGQNTWVCLLWRVPLFWVCLQGIQKESHHFFGGEAGGGVIEKTHIYIYIYI